MVDLAQPRSVLSHDDVRRVVARLAHEIDDRLRDDARGPLAVDDRALAIVGIRTGGAHLARRLADALAEIRGTRPALGVLDITLYRDDVLAGGAAPVVRGSEIDFDVDGRPIVLVDDVLFTGRTVRAALDALLDLGRPSLVRLAVLVDRGLRELPVAADFTGRALETQRAERVAVHLTEEGHPEDAVVVKVIADRRRPGAGDRG